MKAPAAPDAPTVLFAMDGDALYRKSVHGDRKAPEVKEGEHISYMEGPPTNYLFTMFPGESIMQSGTFIGGFFHKPSMYVLTNYGNFAIVELDTGRGCIYHWSKKCADISKVFTMWNLTRDNAAIIAEAKKIPQGKFVDEPELITIKMMVGTGCN